MPYAKVLSYSGLEVGVYNTESYSAFDVFDTFNPNLYLGNISNIPKSLVKVLKEQPHLKFAFIQDGKIDERFWELDKEGVHPYFILGQSPELEKFKVYSNYTTSDFLTYYNGKVSPILATDVVVAEEIIDVDLFCLPDEYVFRIFSPNLIYHMNYCGNINEQNIKNVYASAKVSLCSAHNRLNCIIAGGYPMDINSSEEEVIQAVKRDNTKEKAELLKDALTKTSFHITSDILKYFDEQALSEKVMAAFGEYVK